ncbi:MAG: TadE family protein [Planctomycetota bacterium]
MKTSILRPQRRSTPRRGASTVEMALVAPLLFLVVFGIFEIAIGYMAHHLIQDAARQGCRVGICSGGSNATVRSRIDMLLQAEHITGSTTKILVNNVESDVSVAKHGDQITVQVSVPAAKVSLFPVSGSLKGQFTALCTMRHD